MQNRPQVKSFFISGTWTLLALVCLVMAAGLSSVYTNKLSGNGGQHTRRMSVEEFLRLLPEALSDPSLDTEMVRAIFESRSPTMLTYISTSPKLSRSFIASDYVATTRLIFGTAGLVVPSTPHNVDVQCYKQRDQSN